MIQIFLCHMNDKYKNLYNPKVPPHTKYVRYILCILGYRLYFTCICVSHCLSLFVCVFVYVIPLCIFKYIVLTELTYNFEPGIDH